MFDENIYIHRAMNVLEKLNPQESTFYDHPYFGQIMLAFLLSLTGFPDSFHPVLYSTNSIETLYSVPRIIMGILAIADTYLIYKISFHYYNNKKIAFISSTLFAVTPITWLLRWVLLESLLLPLLMLSILFAIQIKQSEYFQKNYVILRTLSSGIFLGLAIFTKIPAVTFIPFVGFLIYLNGGRNNKLFKLWIIPVILIPLIWPAYSIITGQFNDWLYGIHYQTHREGATLFYSLNIFFKNDPFLLIVGLSGIILSTIRKDFLLLTWFAPYTLFLYFINFVSFYHLILFIPILCIASSRLLVWAMEKISSENLKNIIAVVTVFSIAILGLANIVPLIISDTNSNIIKTMSFVTYYLENVISDNNNIKSKIVLIADPIYSWIPKYVFHLDYEYDTYFQFSKINDKNVIFVIDDAFKKAMISDDNAKKYSALLNDSKTIKQVATFSQNDKDSMITVVEKNKH